VRRRLSAWLDGLGLSVYRNPARFVRRIIVPYVGLAIALTVLIGAGTLNSRQPGEPPSTGQIGALVASIVVGTLSTISLLSTLRRLARESTPSRIEPPLSERMTAAMLNLNGATSRLLNLMDEAASLARERERLATETETNLAELEAQEDVLRKKVVDLQTMPVGAAEQVVRMLSDNERHDSSRDRGYFLAGVGAAIVIQAVATLGFFILQRGG
jgi:hypothetical protein